MSEPKLHKGYQQTALEDKSLSMHGVRKGTIITVDDDIVADMNQR